MATYRLHSEEDDSPWPGDTFTGDWIVEWPNGMVKYKCAYVSGKEEGVRLCFWPNGQLAQQGQCVGGNCTGHWIDYWESGIKFRETVYYGTDNFAQCWFGSDGEITRVEFTYRGEQVFAIDQE